MHRLTLIFRLGIKEFWSLLRDPAMLVLIVYVFSVAVYASATALPETLNKAPIAIVDEDGSPLSARIISAFYPPQFLYPEMISFSEMDAGLDAGDYTFVLVIPFDFQRDVLAGHTPALQLNIDATRMSQAFSGNSYVQQIVMSEVNAFVQRYRESASPAVDLVLRARFNPGLEHYWFGSLMAIVVDILPSLSLRCRLRRKGRGFPGCYLPGFCFQDDCPREWLGYRRKSPTVGIFTVTNQRLSPRSHIVSTDVTFRVPLGRSCRHA